MASVPSPGGGGASVKAGLVVDDTEDDTEDDFDDEFVLGGTGVGMMDRGVE